MVMLLFKSASLGMMGALAAASVATETGVDPSFLVPVSVVVGLVTGAVGYGQLKQKADAAHRRLDEQATTSIERYGELTVALKELTKIVTDMRIENARGHGNGDK